MQKNNSISIFSRAFAMVLATLALMATLPTTAFAASVPHNSLATNATMGSDKEISADLSGSAQNQPAGDNQSGSDEWTVPDYAADLETSVQPYGSSFLYWAMMSLDPNPEVVFDAGLNAVFLSYRINSAGKLAGYYSKYEEAFRLQKYLEQLIDANDIDKAIWQKPDWREQSIGSQLSDATIAKLKAGNYDAYQAIEIIKASDEYLNAPDTIPNLREQVDYHLSIMNNYKRYVIRGLKQLKLAYVGLTDVDIATTEPTVSGVIKTAQRRLEEHPEMQILADVYEVVVSGKTSKALATFQAIDAERCDELCVKIGEVAKVYWPDEYTLLEDARFAVPFPAATYNGPIESPVTTAPSINDLPISATGN